MRHAAAWALGEIGDARAVQPLIAALKAIDKDVRKAAAQALVALYRGGKLDVQAKHRILAMRSTMAMTHHDYTPPSDCRPHEDQGIGVTF